MAQFDLAGARRAYYGAGFSPEDTEAEIKKFLVAQKAPGQSDDDALKAHGYSPPMSGPLRGPAIAGSALATGAIQTLGMPGDIERSVRNKVSGADDPAARGEALSRGTLDDRAAEFVQNALGGASPLLATGGRNFFPTSTDMAKAVPAVANNPALVPQNAGEEWNRAIGTGLGSALPFAATGDVPGLLTGGVAGAAAAKGVNDLLPDAPWWLSAGAAAAAGGVGTGAVNLALSRPKLGKVASKLGPAANLQDAGTSLVQKAEDWRDNILPARVKAAWDPVDQLVPGATPVPVAGLEGALTDITTKGGMAQPLIDALGRNGIPKKLLDALQNKTAQGQLGLGQVYSWDDMRKVRSALGDLMKEPGVLKDISEQDLARLYSATTADLRNAAHSAGGAPALEAFDTANRTSSALYDYARGPVASILKKDAGGNYSPPEVISDRLIAGASKGGSPIAALRAEFPSEVDNLAAGMLRDPRVAPRWAKMSEPGKAALLPDPKHRAVANAELPMRGAAAGIHPGNFALNEIGGGVAGHFLGQLVDNTLLHGTGTGEMIGGALGVAGPPAAAAVKLIASRPKMLRGPIAGISAANALLPAQ